MPRLISDRSSALTPYGNRRRRRMRMEKWNRYQTDPSTKVIFFRLAVSNRGKRLPRTQFSSQFYDQIR